MRRLTLLLITTLCLNLTLAAVSFAAWPWGDDSTLVSINGVVYSPDDFKHWWEQGQDDKNREPEDLERFIEWKLLVQEARVMELNGEPNYLYKTGSFYRAQTRARLKAEEVDDKVSISEEDLRQRYRDEYVPIYRLSLFYFVTEDEAVAALEKMADQETALAALKKKAAEEGEPRFKEGEFYPKDLTKVPGVLTRLAQMSAGQVSEPIMGKNFYIVFHLDEVSQPPETHFKEVLPSLRHNLRKEKAQQLTSGLLHSLEKKFEVRLDEDLLAAMLAQDPDAEMLSRPLFSTSRGDIELAPVFKDYVRERRYLQQKNLTEEMKYNIARSIAYGVLNEVMLTWEAADRHYEESPPFKWVYEHFQEDRLIKELEARMILPGISPVSDKEIETYYEKHLEEFRSGENKLSLVIAEGDAEQVERLMADVREGQEFIAAGEKHGMTLIPFNSVAPSELKPDIYTASQGLETGGISEPFSMADRRHAVVKLVDRIVQAPLPLAKVKNSIGTSLSQEKYSQARQEFIDLLLQQSAVEINQKAWQKVLAEK